MAKILGYEIWETVEGDTFDRLSLEAYDDEMQAGLIMDANPDYINTLVFDAGVSLYIPIIDDVQRPESLPPWRRKA